MTAPARPWPPVRSTIEESSLARPVCAVWGLAKAPEFGRTEAERWERVSQYLWGAAAVFYHHSAARELRELSIIAHNRAHLAQFTTDVERNALDESITRAWSNARRGGVSWLAVHDWLRSSPRFLVHDTEQLHAELAWLSQIAALHFKQRCTSWMSTDGVRHAHA